MCTQFELGTLWISKYASSGENADILGIRIHVGRGVQCGWIGVIRTGVEEDTFGWGYKTEVGVSIIAGATGVPAPGALMPLASGGLGLAGRGRRRKY